MNETARLATRTVNGQRDTEGRLHKEAVQNGTVVTIVIEAVDQALVLNGLRSVCSPDNTLVQVRDTQAVVLGIELEQQCVKALGRVID